MIDFLLERLKTRLSHYEDGREVEAAAAENQRVDDDETVAGREVEKAKEIEKLFWWIY